MIAPIGRAALCGLAATLCLGATAHAQTVFVEAELLEDRWQYPFNSNPLTREKGALYVHDTPQFQFNNRDGMFIVKFGLSVPEQLEGQSFRVRSARIRYWEPKTAAWDFGGLNTYGQPERIELFAARFGPTYEEETWTMADPYIGSTNSVYNLRDPYPVDLRDFDRVEEKVVPYDPDEAPDGYTEWALGFPVGYTPGEMDDSFPVDFYLNVNNPTIQQELLEDFESGFSSWFFSATFRRTGGPGQPSLPNPEVIQRAGLNNTTFGTSQQAPSLWLELEPVYEVKATLLSDRWHYPFNGTPGTRERGSLFLSLEEEFAMFNQRDGMNIYKFGVELPAELEDEEFEIVGATMTVWNIKDSAWEVGSLNSLGFIEQNEMFVARFGPNYTEEDWQGTEPFIGGTLGGIAPRDPWPADLRSGERVEDNVIPYHPDEAPNGYTPWAVGTPIGYTPGEMDDAFPIVFHLDPTNPDIQQELRSHFENGFSSWFLSSTYDLEFDGDPPSASIIPDLIMSEGVSNTTFGTSQEAPSLTFTLRKVTAPVPADTDTWAIF